MAGGLGLFGFGGNAAQTLSDAGYKSTNYSTDNTGLDYSGAFKGYDPTQAQATDIGAAGASPYNAAQLGLMRQLQGQANGTGGPTMADQQLQTGIQSGLASTLAATAGARGGQSPGAGAEAARRNLASQSLGAAGAAGAQRVGEQLSAEQQLAGVTGQGQAEAQAQAALQQQTALANQQAQNQAAQFGSTAQQSLAGLQNQNWQFGTGLNAQEQNAYNQAVYGLTASSQANQQQEGNMLLGQGLTQINPSTTSASPLNSLSSDENAKTNIADSESQMKSFMDTLSNTAIDPPVAPAPPPSTGGEKQGGSSPLSSLMQQGMSGAGGGGGAGAAGGSSAAGAGASSGGAAAGGGLLAGGGGDLALLAAAADGGHFTRAQPVLVGERGPEAVTLPAHSITAGPPEMAPPTPPTADQNFQASLPQQARPQLMQASRYARAQAMAADAQAERQEIQMPVMDMRQAQPQAPVMMAGAPPAVPAMAHGGTMPHTGMAVVGERGPEVVNLPAHSTVIPNDKSQGLLKAMGHADHSYQYKNPMAPGAAPGTHYGPMAQELEKDPVGASTVVQGPDGKKQVDSGRLALALASGVGVLNKRLSTLEEGFAAMHKGKKKGKG